MDNREHLSRHMRRLPLVGTLNTRDMGGYPCKGGVTRWRVYLRSDSPHSMTPADTEALQRYGIKNAIDLRSDGERQVLPSMLTQANGFKSHHVSLSDQLYTADYEGDTPGSMAGLYISLLDFSGPELLRIFHILAKAVGGTLFHCAVGKDRTGVVAMLLLALVGVEEADIVSDYAVSDIYMREVFGKHLPANPNTESLRYRSLPKSMWRVLEHLQEKYGGAEGYLSGLGFSPEEMAAIRGRFIE